MVISKAKTVAEYVKSLPPERRAVIAEIRKVFRKNIPAGYVEVMNWGMPGFEIPLSRYPDTYNGRPLAYAGFAAQKHFYAIYLMCIYNNGEQERLLREAFEKRGKKPDMGKCCIRFKKLDDIPLDVIGKLLRMVKPADLIRMYEESRRSPSKHRC